MPEPELFPDQPEPEQHAEQQTQEDDATNEVKKNVTTLGSRLRVLEEQYSNLRNKSQLTENNLLEFQQDFQEELKSLTQDIVDLKHRVKELKEKIAVIDDQMDDTVQEHELHKLEKYIDLWNPSDFVTHDELKQYLSTDETDTS